MKRIALLVITAMMAVLLVACGDKAEKKVEGQADTQMEQTDNAPAADTNAAGTNDAAEPAADTATPEAAADAAKQE